MTYMWDEKKAKYQRYEQLGETSGGKCKLRNTEMVWKHA